MRYFANRQSELTLAVSDSPKFYLWIWLSCRDVCVFLCNLGTGRAQKRWSVVRARARTCINIMACTFLARVDRWWWWRKENTGVILRSSTRGRHLAANETSGGTNWSWISFNSSCCGSWLDWWWWWWIEPPGWTDDEDGAFVERLKRVLVSGVKLKRLLAPHTTTKCLNPKIKSSWFNLSYWTRSSFYQLNRAADGATWSLVGGFF